jgi:hypothetical protein
MENRKEYIDKMAAKLKVWDDEIIKLEAKAATAKADLKAEIKHHIEDLKAKKEAALQKLKEIRSESGDAWGDLKAGAEQALGSVDDSLKKAWARFK